jgi:hypothetical protein
VRGTEIGGLALRHAIEQQVDAALLVPHHIMRRVMRGGDEAELLELRGHAIRVGRGEFAELEAVEPHGVDVHMIHVCILRDKIVTIETSVPPRGDGVNCYLVPGYRHARPQGCGAGRLRTGLRDCRNPPKPRACCAESLPRSSRSFCCCSPPS